MCDTTDMHVPPCTLILTNIVSTFFLICFYIFHSYHVVFYQWYHRWYVYLFLWNVWVDVEWVLYLLRYDHDNRTNNLKRGRIRHINWYCSYNYIVVSARFMCIMCALCCTFGFSNNSPHNIRSRRIWLRTEQQVKNQHQLTSIQSQQTNTQVTTLQLTSNVQPVCETVNCEAYDPGSA